MSTYCQSKIATRECIFNNTFQYAPLIQSFGRLRNVLQIGTCYEYQNSLKIKLPKSFIKEVETLPYYPGESPESWLQDRHLKKLGVPCV
jgi:hypothetical protein